MWTKDTAAASDEDRSVARVGPERQRLEIGAGTEGELQIQPRIVGDGQVHQCDPDPIIGDEAHLSIVGALHLGLIREGEGGAALHADATAGVLVGIDGAQAQTPPTLCLPQRALKPTVWD